ncbi:uncharacterized protein I206_105088 [Kwoniella pini CBS 10737]|uniref:Uncharacterized protein n=1 Tax=Kwoniella pini CBS 10737 TaxID=1296096 RepID=A0A1B9I8J4_9TREE|nr:uncharacterized protein I206_02628 [Kwoniella pini CBS 10737]OCF51912.1 hypothetical protein I206_02628 [Kwoniella pini CBS 10737]
MLSHMLKQSYHPQYRGDPAVKTRDYVRISMKTTPLHTPSQLKNPSPSHDSSQPQSVIDGYSLISRTTPASNEFLNKSFCNTDTHVQSNYPSSPTTPGIDKKANTFENHDNPSTAPIPIPIPIEIPKQNSIFNYAWKISKDLENYTPSTSLESSSVGSTRMVCLKTKNKLIKTITPSILPNNYKPNQFRNLKNENKKNRPKFIIYESSDDNEFDDSDDVEKEKKHWNTPHENSDSEETLVNENSIYNLKDSLSFDKKCQKPKVKHSLHFESEQEEDSATEADCEDEIED